MDFPPSFVCLISKLLVLCIHVKYSIKTGHGLYRLLQAHINEKHRLAKTSRCCCKETEKEKINQKIRKYLNPQKINSDSAPLQGRLQPSKRTFDEKRVKATGGQMAYL